MKRIIKIMTFLIIFSVVTPLTFSLSKSQETAIIDQIREDYNKTNENEKYYKVRSVTIKKSHGTSYYSVGDSVRYYTENGKLKKVIVFRYLMDEEDNNDKWVEEYYVKNGKPYFLAVTNTEKNGQKVENPLAQRYYFSSDGILIRIVENGEIRSNEKGFEELGADIMEEFYEIKNLK